MKKETNKYSNVKLSQIFNFYSDLNYKHTFKHFMNDMHASHKTEPNVIKDVNAQL